jgi:hypothetical protein
MHCRFGVVDGVAPGGTDGGVPDVDAGVIGLAEYRWREDKAVISDFGETCLSKLIVSP